MKLSIKVELHIDSNKKSIHIITNEEISKQLIDLCMINLQVQFYHYAKEEITHESKYTHIYSINNIDNICRIEKLLLFCHAISWLPTRLCVLSMRFPCSFQEIRILSFFTKYIARRININIDIIEQLLLQHQYLAEIMIKLLIKKFEKKEVLNIQVAQLMIDLDKKDSNIIYIIITFIYAIATCVRTNILVIKEQPLVLKFKPINKISHHDKTRGINKYIFIILEKLFIQYPLIKSKIVKNNSFLYEIFVGADYFDGIHFRSHILSRGGIRLSDRIDYRVEVLQLMYAQNIKNAIIIPNGAKGGYIVHQKAYQQLQEFYGNFIIQLLQINNIKDPENNLPAIAYISYLNSLLEVIDNRIHDEIISNNNHYRYDQEDVYLVVAADKGTAGFSDFANQISIKSRYWLKDAFASGGKSGYNHKTIGITSKGAIISLLTQWDLYKQNHLDIVEIIKNYNFSDSNINNRQQRYSELISNYPRVKDIFYKAQVITIGSMGGDVSGNGMKLLGKVRLIAAISHDYIMIDPEALYDDENNIYKKYKKRSALFDNCLNWDNYKDVLSSSGKIFRRDKKYCTLTREISLMLNLSQDKIYTNTLIKALLQMNVDIIWNGGIGTYYKYYQETNQEVEDSDNDLLRSNSDKIRANIIIEGGNLGMTTQARIDYCKHGGQVRADFIDNAAGVYCSDSEVNIKILLDSLLLNNSITLLQRNQIIKNIENDVMKNILDNLAMQSNMISIFTLLINYRDHIAKKTNFDDVLFNQNKILTLINILALTLKHDNNQSKKVFKDIIQSIKNKRIVETESAYIVSYTKIYLYKILINNLNEIIDNQVCSAVLIDYFPLHLHCYSNHISQHKFKIQILASMISNMMVNILNPILTLSLITQYESSPKELILNFCNIYTEYNINQIYYNIDKQLLLHTLSTMNGLYQKLK